MIRLREKLRTAASQAAAWLEPSRSSCLVCSGPLGYRMHDRQAGRLHEQLCAECIDAIPWVGRPVCLRCGRPVYCPDCIRHPIRAFELNRSAVRYDEKMREWLALYKYRGSERLEGPLADMLLQAYDRLTAEVAGGKGAARPAFGTAAGRLARRILPRAASAPQIWDAVTCVPVSRLRLEERGFNQAERLAHAVADHAKVPFVPLLVRKVHSEKQSMKGRAERFRTMHRVFAPDEAGVRSLRDRASNPREPRRVLLVDDIYTTGATSDACASMIRKSLNEQVKVYVLTWARS